MVLSNWIELKQNNGDLAQKLVESVMTKATVKKCCVPQTGRSGTGPTGCHKPAPITNAGFATGNPEDFFNNFNYDFTADTIIGTDPSWAYYQCGTGKTFGLPGDGGTEDGWYYWNIPCDGPERPPMDMSLLELGTTKLPTYTPGVATLLASTYCKVLASDNYCACKSDRSNCLDIVFNNKQIVKPKLPHLELTTSVLSCRMLLNVVIWWQEVK